MSDKWDFLVIVEHCEHSWIVYTFSWEIVDAHFHINGQRSLRCYIFLLS